MNVRNNTKPQSERIIKDEALLRSNYPSGSELYRRPGSTNSILYLRNTLPFDFPYEQKLANVSKADELTVYKL